MLLTKEIKTSYKKISIIIPVYNRENYISKTLESVLFQTNENWECLIIDDGSTDNTVNVIKSYLIKDKRFKFFERSESKRKGVSSCRNIGLENANGDFVIFLDSDDLLEKNCLENRINFMTLNPNFDVWVFNMAFLDGSKKGKICNLYPRDINNQKEYLKMTLRYQIPFSVTCPLWRINVFNGLIIFDEQFNRLEDPDLHCRALSQNLKFKFDIASYADCFYRVISNDIERVNDLDFGRIFINSYYQFLKKYSNFESIIISNKEVKIELNVLLLRVFKDYIFGSKLYFKQFNIFYKLGLVEKILSPKELFLIGILKIYKNFKLDNIAGLGYFKIRALVFKKINQIDSYGCV